MLKDKIPVWLRQAIKFGSVGVLNTGIDLGIYYLLTHATTLLAGQLTLAKAISYSAGVLNSYFWNRAWTFRSKTGIRYTLAPFILVNLVGIGVNAGVLHFSLETLHTSELIGVAAATVITMAWNFLMSRLVFSRIRQPSPAN